MLWSDKTVENNIYIHPKRGGFLDGVGQREGQLLRRGGAERGGKWGSGDAAQREEEQRAGGWRARDKKRGKEGGLGRRCWRERAG